MDPGSSPPSPERVPTPERSVITWGLGDFFWIYVAGIVASVIGASVGFALTHDTADHTGALTTALSTLAQFGTWFGCIVFIARYKGRGVVKDFGLKVELRDWWALFAGLGLFVIGNALIVTARQHRERASAGRRKTSTTRAEPSSRCSRSWPHSSPRYVRSCSSAACCSGRCGAACRPNAAVIVQALAFALAHPMLSPTLGDLAVVPALFLLGAVSGMVAVTTRKSLGVDPDAHRLQSRHDAARALTTPLRTVVCPLSHDLGVATAHDGGKSHRSRASARRRGCRPRPPARCTAGSVSGRHGMLVCTGCAKTVLITIRMRVAGREIVFHRCTSVRPTPGRTTQGVLSLNEVLELARANH